MFNKNQRIHELEDQVERLKGQVEFAEHSESIYRDNFYNKVRALNHFKEFTYNQMDELRQENEFLKEKLNLSMAANDCLRACLTTSVQMESSVTIHIDDVLIPTETAGDVTLEELTKLVVDGKPIERTELVPIKIGMYKGEKSNV